MTPALTVNAARLNPRAALDEAAALLLGLGFTFALFLGMAHFENVGSAPPPPAIEDLRIVAMPMEPPPPSPPLEATEPAPDTALPFTGLEPGASDSPVSISSLPANLEELIPATTTAPRATLQFGMLHTELKPKAGLQLDERHVYQATEVDQKPYAIVRSVPHIPSEVSGTSSSLRVVLLLVINQNGTPESVRVQESSGNPRFDAIVANNVLEEWIYSPAVHRGKKVKVLAQQAFRVAFSSGYSPFTVGP